MNLTAIYIRVSTQEQATEGYSISEQTDRLNKYCEALKWRVYRVYTDAGYSGSTTSRPALQSLITDVKGHKVNRVLVYKLDRLSRSQKDTLQLIEDVFLANGVDFVSMNENFDTSTPFGRAMVGILAVFAQLEREQIKERMFMGKQARANTGQYSAGKAPIGYDYIPGTKNEPARLIVNDFEKLQIQKVFNDYANGVTASKIAEGLNAAGMTHKYGIWMPKTIRGIIESKTYLGYIKYCNVWYKSDHEPLISEALFNACQTIHEKHVADHVAYNRRPGKATTFFGGLLVCAQCGEKYTKTTTYSNGKKYAYYRCSTHGNENNRARAKVECHNKQWRLKELDDLLIGEIKKLEFVPDEQVAEPEPSTPPQNTLADEVKKIDSQLTRLMDLYGIGSIPIDVLQTRIESLNEKKLALQGEIDRLEKSEIGKLSTATATEYITSFSEVLETGNFDSIRAVITALIEKIELDGEDVTIYWNF